VNLQYRQKLLDETLTPLSELSGAFLSPKSAMDLQFAYFESYLAIKFLVERFGHQALNGALDELGNGLQINDALARHTQTSLEQLDHDFADYAREYAAAVAKDASWEETELPATAKADEWIAFVQAHPDNIAGLLRLSAELVRAKQWSEARPHLEKVRTLFPELIGNASPYALLAKVYRELNESEAERKLLEDWAARDSDALPAYLRLMEIAEAKSDWPSVAKYARRALAVNPLAASYHRYLARASEQTGDRAEAIEAYRALVILDVTDPAEQHYRLARLLRDDGQPDAARREVLKSLEAAPRYRAAHALLLELAIPATEGAKP
jgi:tetratricopeptide (TPR) repeat protein